MTDQPDDHYGCGGPCDTAPVDATADLRTEVERLRRVRSASEDHYEQVARERDAARADLADTRRRLENEQGERRAAHERLTALRVDVGALAQGYADEAGDYVPPLPVETPYNLMLNHARDLRSLLDEHSFPRP